MVKVVSLFEGGVFRQSKTSALTVGEGWGCSHILANVDCTADEGNVKKKHQKRITIPRPARSPPMFTVREGCATMLKVAHE